MLEDLNLDKNAQKHIIRKIINIAIRCINYVFFRRNKSWTNPDLLDFWFASYPSLHSFFFPPLYCNVDKLSYINRSADSQLYATLRERCMIVK